MYWTNFTEKLATIEKARMDGVQERKQPLTEMKRELAEPGNLVADPNGEHIYYIETKKKKIVRLSLKGNTCSYHSWFYMYTIIKMKHSPSTSDLLDIRTKIGSFKVRLVGRISHLDACYTRTEVTKCIREKMTLYFRR